MLVRDIEKAIAASEKIGFGFGPMTLSKSALVHLVRRLEPHADGKPVKLLELGGGQSTVFWSQLATLGLLDVQVVTLEHHVSWVADLEKRIVGNHVKIVSSSLKQIDDEGWKRMFAAEPGAAAAVWEQAAVIVPEHLHTDYTIRNAFYGEAHRVKLEPVSLDGMIVDGPHGNGRSLAYPLFAAALKPGSFILVDDFDHYPFLSDLAAVLDYEEVYREVVGSKRWVLVQVR